MTDRERPLALVTGASSGIGYHLALQFLEHGYDLVVAADEDSIRAAADELTGLGGQVHPVQIDLARRGAAEELHAAVLSRGRPLAAAALNAGVGAGGAFVDNDLDDELRIIDLNVVSAVVLAKLLVQEMVPRGEGRLLLTSSVTALAPTPFHAVYAASKSFVQSFGQSLRNELQGSGVTVTTMLPGPTDTEFFERADMLDTKVAEDATDDPADVAARGFAAMASGDGNVLSGSFKSRAVGAASEAAPDAVGAAFNRRIHEPGSADH